MNFTNSIFLNHALPMALIFWLWCWYQFWKQKVALKRCERLRAKERFSL